MLTVVCWRWGKAFGPAYVNRLRAALELHLHLPHELVCVTDDATGIDRRVRIVSMPATYAGTPRCRRRMQAFSREWATEHLGARLLLMDLDMVLVGDITPLVDRPEPLVCWLVGYAKVYAGAFILLDAGHLNGLWRQFEADPEGYPHRAAPSARVPSDLAMLNAYLRRLRKLVPHWTERHGFVSYFGAGYEQLEQHGVGPSRPELPRGARVVALGGADLEVLESGRYDWVREHWTALPAEAS